MTYVSNLYIN